MTTAAHRTTGRTISAGVAPLFSQGFRPFFLAAGLWAAAALPLWMWMLATGGAPPSRFDPLGWHIHEMLFGFVMAAVAGFLLTAIPSWTHRAPVQGLPLAALAGLWLLGRIACLVSTLLPAWLAVAADLAFPAALLGVTAREIAAGRSWRNLPMLAPVAVLAIANLLMHLEAAGAGVPDGIGWRLGLVAILVLLSVIGGRIVPSFTRNWLAMRNARGPEPAKGWLDRLALGTLHAGLLAWAVLPPSRVTGVLLLVAAAANLGRLLRWRGVATAAEPLLLILHVGYAWLVLGAALLGVAILDADASQDAAIHTLTAGAAGTMILAVMTRATRGHTGRALRAGPGTALIYAFVTLAAIARVAAGFAPGPATMPLLLVAAALWVAAFGGFAILYGPMLARQRRPDKAQGD